MEKHNSCSWPQLIVGTMRWRWWWVYGCEVADSVLCRNPYCWTYIILSHLLQGSSKWRHLSHHYWCIAESGWKACFCWVSDFPYWFIWIFAVLLYSFSLVLGVNFMFANLGIYWRFTGDAGQTSLYFSLTKIQTLYEHLSFSRKAIPSLDYWYASYTAQALIILQLLKLESPNYFLFILNGKRPNYFLFLFWLY